MVVLPTMCSYPQISFQRKPHHPSIVLCYGQHVVDLCDLCLNPICFPLLQTYIGSILVSVNPYKMYNLYGTETVLRYEGKSLGENPPHLFAIANAAYSKMIDAKHNQCIIISGESGSGKTEATKLILRYLAAIHHKRRDNATQQILEATPLLESFGNAKTVRNDNSSRFGKYIEIFLEDSEIEPIVVVSSFQAKNERNYHIFYELLAGLSSQQKQRFYLQEAETYYYLNQGGNCEIPGKQDGEDFRRLLSAMEVLGFSSEEQSSIFRILSSVLHLGNVYFEKYETDSQEIASVVSAREIRVVAELLQISPEGLQKSITYKVTETMREKIFTPLTVESAVDARDAVAKILYSLLFSWLTDRINKLVSPRTESLSIAILDIYGFEDLSINSFEQLCINYANEYLQYFFNKIVFKVEQEEYMREQIDWKEITFSNNQPCLDLISQRPHGILRVLDDQSCFPQATDHTFLQKCHYHHSNSPLYSKPKMPLPEFTIKHFAGKVTYQVHKFLEKNHDQVRQEVLELFVSSRTRVRRLFSGHAVKAMPMKSSTITRRYQAPTVAAKFQQSLMELVEKMERCNPFFVRCFKPNNKKEMDLFELDLVSAQLRYSGVLETIRIRKEGFPVRIPFATFIKRYKILLGLTQEIKADGENCVTILKQICPVNKGMYRIGLTKLFMKENLHHILDSKRDRLMKIAALTLQRYARGFLARKHYNVLRHKIILLQAQARGYLARKKYQKVKESLLKVKSVVRAYVNRKRFLRMREEARRLAEQEHQRLQMELTKREVVSVTHLDIPAELAGLLHALPVQSEDSVGQVESPKVQAEEQLTLVLDINNYPFSKFVRLHFKEPLLGMLTSPLDEPLTQVEEDLKPEAVNVFRLILRFMGDPHLNGIQENLFGNYILQIGLANPGLRDEIFSQIANQVWRNTNKNNAERGWLLLATCLSCFAPSPKMDKYLLKFVSDYAHTGFKAMCQHKLMQALRKAGDGSDAARTYPPCLLEWTANKKGASMAMHISCLDGVKLLGPVSCWTTGEELAQDILRHRGAVEGCRGWSVVRKDRGEWAELAGHDYVMDLVSDLELMPDFPKQKSYFLISSESPARLAIVLCAVSVGGILVNITHPFPLYKHTGPTPYSKPSALKPEHVHHTKLNCQHIVEPTHNIKDIIKQHQQPPEALRYTVCVSQWARVCVETPLLTAVWKQRLGTALAGVWKGVALSGSVWGVRSGEYCQTLTCLSTRCFQVLYPKDNVSSPVLLDLIFRQILSDALSDTCVRISKEEQLRMRSLLAENKIQASTPVKEEAVKRKIVLAARDVWEVYFSRLFPATGSVGTGVQLLAVSHRGVHLLKLVRSRGATGENVKVLRSYSYADVLFVTIPSKNMLEFNLTNEKLILFSSKAPQVKSMIDHFITELKKDSNYVVAVKSYMASESSAMLSFHKGDIIRLQPMEGYCYGCIVRKKVVYMEELKRYTPDFGWKFGAFHGRSGLFPVEFVQPVAAPDFIHLSVDKKEEPKDKRGKVAVSSTVAAAVASTAFRPSGFPFHGESFSAVLFPCAVVMKFMGDSPLKGQTEQDAIYTVLKLCREHEVMKDEAYCQIIKQVTNNTSSKVGCQWRMGTELVIIACITYHRLPPTPKLSPTLISMLHVTAPLNRIAHACEQNLRKTFQFGGRTQYPGGMEFKAMLAGRSSKRQLFLLPGSVERHVKIKTCSVALDVIEELCYEMGLHSPEAVEEYSLFVITNKGQNVHPLNRKDYILDVATEMEAIDSNFTFWFRRLIWAQPLKFDNELCVTVHYNQVVPDYLKGLLHILTQERRSEQQLQQVSKLAALQHRAKDGVYLPSVREVQEYVPPQIYWQQRPQLWLNMVTDHTQQVQALSAHQARAQFLGLVSIFPMFGSSFFFIQSSSNSAIDTPCILAINQNGLSFLNKDTHELMVNFPLKQVQSTRTQRLATGSSYPYVEIKLGDLMSQRTTQLQLNQALDMCRVIAVHVESILTAREKRLTLPPSEITLL
uniref:Myosin XVA n=1 Tax=Callorhinchus milii TaxID=7868 RepID=A0A4W3JGV5_CALMI